MIAAYSTSGGHRRRRVVSAVSGLLVAALLLASGSNSGASDGNFQSVLLEAGCPTAKVDKLSDRNGTVTYRANCFSTSHKVIIVTCMKGVCFGGHPSEDGREDRG